ncbi:MAG: HDOD domain-containing protein [Aeoliella sp.]
MTATATISNAGPGNGALQLQNEALEALFQRLSELSSLPSIALRIIEAAVDEATDAEDLRQLIEKDPALSARIIRIVNSSFYAVRQEVADLKSAIALLGTKQIRNIAITVFVARQFRPSNGQDSLDRTRLWNHAMAVGAISRLIATTTRKCDPEEAYLAGLLHDIGLLIIDQHLSRHVPKIQSLIEGGETLHDAAQQVLTFDPSQLGAYVAWRSHFPPRLVSAIEFQRKPDEYDGEDRTLTDLVAVADYIATRSGMGVMEQSQPVSPSEDVFARLELGSDVLSDIWSKIDDTLAATQSIAAF